VVTGVARGTATITAVSQVRTQRTGSITVSVGALWTGAASTAWAAPANWLGGVVPDSTLDATIPATAPYMPVLSANAVILDLDAATGSTVNLGGYTLELIGALVGSGTVSNGTLKIRGGEIQGNVPSLLVTTGLSVQAATKATGPVSIQGGSLEISGAPLSISIP
jgi:hypothetical protein